MVSGFRAQSLRLRLFSWGLVVRFNSRDIGHKVGSLLLGIKGPCLPRTFTTTPNVRSRGLACRMQECQIVGFRVYV